MSLCVFHFLGFGRKFYIYPKSSQAILNKSHPTELIFSWDMLEDYTLIQACLNGSRKAQSTLYEKYASSLYSVCIHYARNKSDVDDIMQEGFAKMYSCLQQFKFKGSFEGWMKRIMINSALAYYRKKSNVIYVDVIHDSNKGVAVTQNVLDEINNTELLAMIHNLPTGCRTVFEKFVIEGFSHKEIAEQLNISEGTSKSQLFDAKKALRKTIQETAVTRSSAA